MAAGSSKAASKSSFAKRTTTSSSAKASITGTKPAIANPRARVEQARQVAVVHAEADENAAGPSNAMEVTPRFVRVPFGRTRRLNYQEVLASAARKNGMPQQPVTPVPTAMNRPPLSIFDAPIKVILPSVARRRERTTTEPVVHAPSQPADNGGDTDREIDADPLAPQTSVSQQPSGDATDTDDDDDEGRGHQGIATTSQATVAVEFNGNSTDVEVNVTPCTLAPAPSLYIQCETPVAPTATSTPAQPLANFQLGKVCSNNSFGYEYRASPMTRQSSMMDVCDTVSTSTHVGPLAVTSQYPFWLSHPDMQTQQSYFSTATQQPLPSPTSCQPSNPTPQGLLRTGTDFNLAAILNQMTMQATASSNNFGGFAQVHPDTVATPIVHHQGLNMSTPLGFSDYGHLQLPCLFPHALAPSASQYGHDSVAVQLQPQQLYYSAPASFVFQSGHGNASLQRQAEQLYPYVSSEMNLQQSAPARCGPPMQTKRHVLAVKVDLELEPQTEWHTRIANLNLRPLRVARNMHPLDSLIGQRPSKPRGYSGQRNGPLFVPTSDEERRLYAPTPIHRQTKRTPHPARGSEEDLIARLALEHRYEAEVARRALKKAGKHARKNAKREARESNKSGAKASKRAVKKWKMSK